MKLVGRLCVGLAVAAGSMGATAGDEQTARSEKSVIRVESIRLDLGTIKAGDEGVGTFVLHNDGAQAVKVLRAKPS
jgi:hypothetical protein